ncbi:MAG TPA: DUF6073 family protein [Longimicrobiaceae bacterium]|nr:DUF6073 family protein [Longimicrobiaceae bacterium]
MATRVHDFSDLVLRPEGAQEARAADGSPLPPSPKSVSELRVFRMAAGGLDRLNFATWDTIEVMGHGEDTVEFRGYYVIERENPTSADWSGASVNIFMRELNVSGTSAKFGRIRASTNEEMGQSGGQVRAGTAYAFADSPKLCAMLGYMQFELADAGITVFNKEPILLEHKITHIPPVGQGGGTREGVEYPLYRKDDPDGPPVAILKRVRTHIGAWLE